MSSSILAITIALCSVGCTLASSRTVPIPGADILRGAGNTSYIICGSEDDDSQQQEEKDYYYCEDTLGLNARTHCYPGIEIKLEGQVTRKQKVCACISYFGFQQPVTVSSDPACLTMECMSKADACTAFSWTSYLWLTTNACAAAFSFALCLAAVHIHLRTEKKSLWRPNAAVTSLVFAGLGAACEGVMAIVSMRVTLDFTFRRVATDTLLPVLLSVSQVLRGIALLTIGLMWYQVAMHAPRIGESASVSNLGFNPTVYTVLVSTFFTLVVGCLYGVIGYESGALAGWIGVLTIAISFLVGARKILKMFPPEDQRTRPQRRQAARISQMAKGVSGATVLHSIGAPGYAVALYHAYQIPSVSTTVLLGSSVIIAQIANLLYLSLCLKYLHRSLVASRRRIDSDSTDNSDENKTKKPRSAKATRPSKLQAWTSFKVVFPQPSR